MTSGKTNSNNSSMTSGNLKSGPVSRVTGTGDERSLDTTRVSSNSVDLFLDVLAGCRIDDSICAAVFGELELLILDVDS